MMVIVYHQKQRMVNFLLKKGGRRPLPYRSGAFGILPDPLRVTKTAFSASSHFFLSISMRFMGQPALF